MKFALAFAPARPVTPVAGRFSLLPALALTAVLSACAAPPVSTPPPEPAPAPVAEPVTAPPAARPAEIRRAARVSAARKAEAEAEARAEKAAATPASRNLTGYYQSIQDVLKSRGKMRIDAGSMADVTAATLTDSFVQIALRDEYQRKGDALVASAHPAPLRRWEQPVRVQMVFGDSTGPAARKRRSAEIAAFARRLGGIANHPVSASESPGNFVVMSLSEDERRNIGPRLAELVPGIPASDIAAIQNLAPQNYCTVFAYSDGGGAAYVRAVAVLRTELPPDMFTSCVHEELAQGMGLSNDSPRVRPSIFNDDEEFARLTQLDELLLRILYDPRLRPGMTEDEARPIVAKIAPALLGLPET